MVNLIFLKFRRFIYICLTMRRAEEYTVIKVRKVVKIGEL